MMKETIEQIIAVSKKLASSEPLVDEWGVPRPDPAPNWTTSRSLQLPSQSGAPFAKLEGKIAEFYAIIDGCTNILPHERWCSVAEMSNPLASVWDDVSRFDPFANRSAADKKALLERVYPPWADDIWNILEICGQEPAEEMPKTSALVLFGYNLSELAHHRTYLYFQDANGGEPIVYNPWYDEGLAKLEIDDYLGAILKSFSAVE